MGLVDIGVRGGTGRYINYYLGRGEDEEVSNVVSTSLLFYTLISVLVFAASAVLAFFFGDIFPKIEPEYVREAQWVLLLLGLNVWIGFFSSTFSQLLTAAERFDLQMICRRHRLGAADGRDDLGSDHRPGAGGTGAGQGGVRPAGLRPGGRHGAVEGPARPHPPAPLRWASFREVFSFGSWAFLGKRRPSWACTPVRPSSAC